MLPPFGEDTRLLAGPSYESVPKLCHLADALVLLEAVVFAHFLVTRPVYSRYIPPCWPSGLVSESSKRTFKPQQRECNDTPATTLERTVGVEPTPPHR